MDIKEAEKLVNYQNLLLTGAREGEIIKGIRTQSKNTILKIVKGNVPPCKLILDNIREFPNLYSFFIDRLKYIPFFRRLTKLQRREYLEDNESVLDIYLSDLDLMVDVIECGEGDFLNLDLSNLDLINCTYSIKYLYNLFPKKPTSDGLKGRHTLIFRRNIWKVVNLFQEYKDVYDDLVIDTTDGCMKMGIHLNSSQVVYRFDSFESDYNYENSKKKFIPNEEKTDLGIVDYKSRKLSENDIIEIITQIFPNKNVMKYYNYIKKCTETFTPSGYKSLLQKIIRKRSERCIFYTQNERFSFQNEFVLCCILGLLVLHPGSFVPDIQKYVRGVESALKRTLITLYEDAIIYDKTLCIRVACYAFLCQRIPKYYPPLHVISDCMKLAIHGLCSPRAYIYKFDRGIKPYTPSLDIQDHQIVSLIMDELRSFETDLLMIRYISTFDEDFVENSERDRYMEIYHFVDFHCQPEIVYYLDLKYVDCLSDRSNAPYHKLFRKLFHEVTGINPRRNKQHEYFDIDPKIVSMVQKAQKNLYRFKIKKHNNLDYEICDIIDYEFKLDDGVLAGMLGSTEIKYKNINCLVQLSPKDPHIIHVIKKPSRTMKDPFLKEEDEESVINIFQKKIEKGIRLKAIPPITPSFIGVSLKKDDDEFKIITPKKKEISWSKISNQKINIPLFEIDTSNIKYNVDLLICDSLKNLGIDVDYLEKLERLLSITSQEIIFRVLFYIDTKNDIIEMTRVSRDGGGTLQIPIKEDVGAFKVLCRLTLIFPMIITLIKPTIFKIHNVCLLDIIKKNILSILRKNTSRKNYIKLNWGDIGEKNNRINFEYQESCLLEMKDQHRQGNKGCFLWLDVGMGKTLIVMYYLKYLILNEDIHYVLYTLPSSAIESVIQEIEYFGFDYCIIVPIKSKKYEKYNFSKDKKPQKFKINIIEHDHLRRCSDELIHYSSKSVFVIDEVHKSLNESKRTSVCLNLSKLSKYFVALTGTPIIDSNTYKLMWWLEQIVPFKVNDKNFWVAVHSMISRKVSTNVECIYNDVKLDIFDERYDLVAPVGVGGLNTSPKHSDIIRAMEMCYRVCDNYMVDVCYEHYLKNCGLFVVTRNKRHLLNMYNLLLEVGIEEKDVFLIQKDSALYFTDETVERKLTHDYKFVLTTLNNSTGYTVTRLSKMITSVYPSNNATREQLEGRINRVSQNSDSVEYITIHCGILSYIYHKHRYAKSLSLVLKELSDEI